LECQSQSFEGSEQAGFRPVVIISGNMLNANLPVVIVMPLTNKVKRYKGNPVLSPSKTNGLKALSEMLVFHIVRFQKTDSSKNWERSKLKNFRAP
jgi:mRNA interferase MazF